ncbi:MAG: oligopeptide/dipeptide ABC transporter ATP-binding protein [Gammaproteobacteria bacterium]
MSAPLLAVRDLCVHFPMRVGGLRRGRLLTLKAVDGVSFDLEAGETLGLVGESGCGKSTLGRAVLQLISPTSGRVAWQGEDITGLSAEAMRPKRRAMQIVFQDPLAALNPRMTVGEIVAEPLRAHQPELGTDAIQRRAQAMLEQVGLSAQMRNRYPHEFSGGQCQRIGIARAMILAPKLIVCDEPVSALDVSIQAQIVNLLVGLQREFGLALLFISHDLAVVRHISRRVMVLYLGKIMEIADRDAIYAHPRHPYTQALIAAAPIPDPDVEQAKRPIALQGEPPSPLAPPSGCVFRTRCPKATALCAAATPPLEYDADGHHAVACHHWRDDESRQGLTGATLTPS